MCFPKKTDFQHLQVACKFLGFHGGKDDAILLRCQAVATAGGKQGDGKLRPGGHQVTSHFVINSYTWSCSVEIVNSENVTTGLKCRLIAVTNGRTFLYRNTSEDDPFQEQK
jgi:hypothetical protein